MTEVKFTWQRRDLTDLDLLVQIIGDNETRDDNVNSNHHVLRRFWWNISASVKLRIPYQKKQTLQQRRTWDELGRRPSNSKEVAYNFLQWLDSVSSLCLIQIGYLLMYTVNDCLFEMWSLDVTFDEL